MEQAGQDAMNNLLTEDLGRAHSSPPALPEARTAKSAYAGHLDPWGARVRTHVDIARQIRQGRSRR